MNGGRNVMIKNFALRIVTYRYSFWKR